MFIVTLVINFLSADHPDWWITNRTASPPHEIPGNRVTAPPEPLDNLERRSTIGTRADCHSDLTTGHEIHPPTTGTRAVSSVETPCR
ncbi:hypothetical protein FRC11_009936, partial [Ceratobasidium sp. 423]